MFENHVCDMRKRVDLLNSLLQHFVTFSFLYKAMLSAFTMQHNSVCIYIYILVYIYIYIYMYVCVCVCDTYVKYSPGARKRHRNIKIYDIDKYTAAITE
jgi:hypothetical protein